jgi:hypothetical protein
MKWTLNSETGSPHLRHVFKCTEFATKLLDDFNVSPCYAVLLFNTASNLVLVPHIIASCLVSNGLECKYIRWFLYSTEA